MSKPGDKSEKDGFRTSERIFWNKTKSRPVNGQKMTTRNNIQFHAGGQEAHLDLII